MASTEMTTFLKSLGDNQLIEFKRREDFKKVMDADPPKTWVKKNPYAKNTEYLPIDKVEVLLDSIFQEWQVEIKSVSQLAQSICAIVRLHYVDPLNQQWRYHDGVGAVPLKTEKGADASDLSKILSNSVQTGAPAAVSFAIKDASEHLGNIFGKNLNREGSIKTPSVYSKALPKNVAEEELIEKRMQVAKIIEKDKNKSILEALDETVKLSIKEMDEIIKKAEAKNANQG